MTPEATSDGIPVYPNAVPVDHRTVSLRGGGGGADSTYASADPFEAVVGFYECRIGPGDRAVAGSCRWVLTEVAGGWESCRLVVVEPYRPAADGAVTGTRIYIGRRDRPGGPD